MSTRANTVPHSHPNRIKAAFQEACVFIAAVRTPVQMAGIGFLLSFCDCLSVPSSFALVFAAALIKQTKHTFAPAIGIAAACLMRLVWRLPMDYAQLSGLILLFLSRRGLQIGTSKQQYAIIALLLLPRLIAGTMAGDASALLLSAFSVALGAAAYPAFLISARSVPDVPESFSQEEKACLVLLATLLLCGMARLQLFSINLGLLATLLITLISGYCQGHTMGVMTGLVSGLSLVLSNFPPVFPAILISCGLGAGLLQKREPRLICAFLFLLSGSLAAVLMQPALFSKLLLHLFIAALLFLPLRRDGLTRFEEFLQQVKPANPLHENSYAADALMKWETAISAIAHALPMPATPDDIEDEAAHSAFLRAVYERDMVVTHLTAMAHAVKRLSSGAQAASLNDLRAGLDIERTLKTIAFPGHLLYAKLSEGRLHAVIEADVVGFNRISPTQLTDALFSQCKLDMTVTHETRTRIEIEQAPRFEIDAGHACIGCTVREMDIGDAVLFSRLPFGKQLIMLSDGMGHGEAAGIQSSKTLELLKLCLEAGYTREQAIIAVNGMMLLIAGGDLFATVDLFALDLWTGVCEVLKLGACQSYLVRNGKIKAIWGDALPLGILEQVSPESTRLKLMDDDYLILMSDGVSDAFNDDALLTEQLLLHLSPDVQRSADAFLRTALICSGGVPKDDMTILIIRLSSRHMV